MLLKLVCTMTAKTINAETGPIDITSLLFLWIDDLHGLFTGFFVEY